MTTVPPHDTLGSLGIPGLAAAETSRLTWAASGESQALGAAPAALAFATLAASGFVDVVFASVAMPVLGRLDAAVSASTTRVMRVAAPRGHGVHVHLPSDVRMDDVAYVPDEDPGTVYIDLAAAPTVLVRAGGDAVVLQADESGVAVTGVAPRLDALASLDVPPPVATWLATSRDSWLVEQVTPLVDAADPWSSVVAAGMLTRLTTPSSADEARAWLDAARRGTAEATVAGPRQWARGLTAVDVERLQAQVIADAAALCLDVEDATDDVDARADGWDDLVREVAHRRDDLEGVLLLLDAAGADAPVRSALAVVDREGAVLRLAVGGAVPHDDERLRRVWLKDPDAWWAHAG
ncbi:MAG TPA: hypothetical protein VMF13_04845 [Luteitalea sp.]|nr:hypothetical protein [Luteitalea sp.]